MPFKIEKVYFGNTHHDGQYMVIRFQKVAGILLPNRPEDVGITFKNHACLFRDTTQEVSSDQDNNIFEFSSPPPITIDILRKMNRLINAILESSGEPHLYAAVDTRNQVIFHISETDFNLLAVAPQRYREYQNRPGNDVATQPPTSAKKRKMQ